MKYPKKLMQRATSTLWKGISTAGALIDQGASGGLYFDASSAGDSTQTSHSVGGAPVLNTSRSNPQYTGGDTDSGYGYSYCMFDTLAAKSGVSVPELLRVLGLMPLEGYDGEGGFYLRNYGERLPLRGGYWGNSSLAGVCALNCFNARAYSYHDVGFRAAFVNL